MQSRAALRRRRVGWVLIGASIVAFPLSTLGDELLWDQPWNTVARLAAAAVGITGIALIARADRYYDRGRTVPFDDELDDDTAQVSEAIDNTVAQNSPLHMRNPE